MSNNYDSILIVSFGGPESKEEVIPFLENVTRGRNVPRSRLEQVAEHYYHFGGKSPINSQNLALIDALRKRLNESGPDLPIYFGNRNWSPYITEALTTMQKDGKYKALSFFTSLFSCYSGCRQYQENIKNAQSSLHGKVPEVDKLRMGFNHPRFIAAMKSRIESSLDQIPKGRRELAHLVFTAHSIPLSMAERSSYQLQLNEAARLISGAVGNFNFNICFQSRSGPPQVKWLEPDINEKIRALSEEGVKDLVVVPLGFVSDHLEVLYDLDVEAAQTAAELGINFVRSQSVGTHPEFIEMIRDLIIERIEGSVDRPACGSLGAWHDFCPSNCCLPS